MAKDIEPKLKLIKNYLTLKQDEIFVIPEYQRAYSWSIDQCDKLWQDIEDFQESKIDDPYFFGTIIVDCSNSDEFRLIDGQQRTTTFLLLFKALVLHLIDAVDSIPDDEDSESLKAGLCSKRDEILKILFKAEAEQLPQLRKGNYEECNNPIIGNRSINELYKEETAKIIGAINFSDAENKAIKIRYKKKDNKYTNHFSLHYSRRT